MNMNIAIEPILALVIGILILLVPRFLNYFVAVLFDRRGYLGANALWSQVKGAARKGQGSADLEWFLV